jgi:hypothetical protein
MSGTRTAAALVAAPAARDVPEAARAPVEIAAEVATVLAGMTYEERVRAYRSGALSVHELHVAAAWLPDQMPLLNGELEWIAIDLE